ncbi:MAG TPA: large conductance mechanosensitive channel protein MscL [Burkholderiaceae bacterium]|nr:large conductance mechanosensitive channel protein MscL [Burkholderiaceae bacterium]
MGMLAEFKTFAVRGNVMDLAVGVIIGAAFSKIVDSLVNDLIMPVISFLFGGRFDFSNLFIVLGTIPPGVPRTLDALKKAGVPLLAYGSFVTILINFILLAFVVFMLVRALNRWRAQPAPAPAPAAPPRTEALLAEIRDLLARPEPAR